MMHARLAAPRIDHVDAADTAALAAIDAFVNAHPAATPFHRTAWNIAVARGCGQDAHWLISRNARGDVDGVLPLTELHSPLFGRALTSVGFAVDGGILAADRHPREGGGPYTQEPVADATLEDMDSRLRGNDDVAARLADAAWDLAERLSCPTLELRGGALPEGWAIDATTYLGHVRALATDDQAELLAIPRKQRAEVRRSLDLPLTIEIGSAPADRAAHHAVYAESVHNLGTPVFPRALFDAVLDGFGEDADILTVRHEGVAVASVLSLYWRGTVYPYWGGGAAAARALRANDRMYFALMGHARARGCTHFDFGRSKAGTGAAAFKHNWGFEGQPLAYARRNTGGGAGRDTNPLSAGNRLKVEAWKRLPRGLADRLGPLLSRGLG